MLCELTASETTTPSNYSSVSSCIYMELLEMKPHGGTFTLVSSATSLTWPCHPAVLHPLFQQLLSTLAYFNQLRRGIKNIKFLHYGSRKPEHNTILCSCSLSISRALQHKPLVCQLQQHLTT